MPVLEKLLPTPPSKGPPLPRGLSQKWPTSIQELISGAVTRSAKIAKQRIAEKKGVPLPMVIFGPLGSYLVKE